MVTKTELQNWTVTTTCLDYLQDIDYAALAVKQYNVKALVRYNDGRQGYHYKNYAYFSKAKLQLAVDDLRSNIFVDEFIIYDEFNNEQRWERKISGELETTRRLIIGNINQAVQQPVIIDEGYHAAALNRWIHKSLKNEAHFGDIETVVGGRKYRLHIGPEKVTLYDGKGHVLKEDV